jgi:hypothetical protein
MANRLLQRGKTFANPMNCREHASTYMTDVT